MAEADIGMLTTVLIGNSNTFVRHGLMITPRGYSNKYEVADGERATRDGQRAGHSLSTGLDGWIESIQQSSRSAAELAQEYRLPAAYIHSVLDTPLAEEMAGEESEA